MTPLEQFLAAGWIRPNPKLHLLILPQYDLWNDPTWIHPVPCSVIAVDYDYCEDGVKPAHVSMPLCLFRNSSYDKKNQRTPRKLQDELSVQSDHIPYDPYSTTDFVRASEDAFNNSLEVLLNTKLFNGHYRDVLLGPNNSAKL